MAELRQDIKYPQRLGNEADIFAQKMSNLFPGFFLTFLEAGEQVNIVYDVIIILLIFGYLQSANSSLKLLI